MHIENYYKLRDLNMSDEEKNRLSGSVIFWSTFLLIVAMFIYSLWS